jgi:hypothetical protein
MKSSASIVALGLIIACSLLCTPACRKKVPEPPPADFPAEAGEGPSERAPSVPPGPEPAGEEGEISKAEGPGESGKEGDKALRRSLKGKTGWRTAVEPKALSPNVLRGLDWLSEHQNPDGGWGQGEESRHMGRQGGNHAALSNVADTCAAALALIRSGSTPAKGAHAALVRGAVAYVCGKVERSDAKSLWITDVRGTRLQQKLGTFIDTFMAAYLLAEVKGTMHDAPAEARVAAALEKVIGKMEKHQTADGSWKSKGWAPVLAGSWGKRGLNRAAQKGVAVREEVLDRAEKGAQDDYESSKGLSSGFAGSAGVKLYGAAATANAMNESNLTNARDRDRLEKALIAAQGEEAKRAIRTELQRIRKNEETLKSINTQLVNKLRDQRFLKGFGSNGGEEFLSYMQIGENLVLEGGAVWKEWDEAITRNLCRVQNKDGSWSGHHCITGRTFCTAAAVLVLTVDRAKFPLSGKLRRK